MKVGVLATLVFGLLLFMVFYNHDGNEEDVPNGEDSDPESVDFSRAGLPFLRESVRLAELKAKEMNEAITAVEKKSFQLVVFCIALFGYLLATSEFKAHWYEAIRLIALIFLFVSAVFCFKAEDLRVLGTMGFKPAVCAYHWKSENDDSMESMLRDLLKQYNNNILLAFKTQNDKAKYLEWAKYLLICGIAFALGWLIAENIFLALKQSPAPHCLSSTMTCCWQGAD